MSFDPVFGECSQEDIFLSPHPDDICFSLGHFAQKRQAGTLLCIFPVSCYRVGKVLRNSVHTRATTRKRLSEDAVFADLCGLVPGYLEFYDAMTRGQDSFDIRNVNEIANKIQVSLIHALLGPRIGQLPEPRPWLFCPSGIGGHVDHVATLLVIAKNLPLLRKYYRLAFYEDLPYASDLPKYQKGLVILGQVLGDGMLKRYWFNLDQDAQKAKMGLIRVYDSQLTPEMNSMKVYTPAAMGCDSPHEALWLFQDEMHQLAG